jgi:NAD(P)-dependent dehydrogenase (short-subunit alcohol dehydrogenase family)
MVNHMKGAFGLEGQVCVVTGAGGGIGQGIALALAAEGARVVVLDINEAGASETVGLIKEAGGTALALACDVTNRASIESAATVVTERWGAPEVLVNNAAGIRPGPLDSLAISDWNATLDLNLTAYLACAQVFTRGMREKRQGALVHISSAAADFVTPFGGAYSVSKAGVTMLARQLAVEWGPLGLRSNAIVPGFIYTPLAKSIYDKPGVMESRVEAVPCRRIGQPDDIAQAVLFLASPRASYVNGAELRVDGGVTSNFLTLVTPRHDQRKIEHAKASSGSTGS